jgi:hypothetical protein
MESIIRNLFGTKSPSQEAIDASGEPNTSFQNQQTDITRQPQLSLRGSLSASEQQYENIVYENKKAEAVNTRFFKIYLLKLCLNSYPRFDRS